MFFVNVWANVTAMCVLVVLTLYPKEEGSLSRSVLYLAKHRSSIFSVCLFDIMIYSAIKNPLELVNMKHGLPEDGSI